MDNRVVVTASPRPVRVKTEPGAGVILTGPGMPKIALQAAERIVNVSPESPTTVVESGVGQGPQGARGSDGATLPPFAFSYGDASPLLLYTLDGPALLSELQLLIDAPFDGVGAALRIYTDYGQELLAEDQNSPSVRMSVEVTPGLHLPVGTELYLQITPGAGATQGSGQILITLN